MCCMPGNYDTSLHVLRRLTVYDLAVRGSWLPGGAVGLTIGPDNIEFRRRLRRAHPETEEALQAQRQACSQARPVQQ